MGWTYKGKKLLKLNSSFHFSQQISVSPPKLPFRKRKMPSPQKVLSSKKIPSMHLMRTRLRVRRGETPPPELTFGPAVATPPQEKDTLRTENMNPPINHSPTKSHREPRASSTHRKKGGRGRENEYSMESKEIKKGKKRIRKQLPRLEIPSQHPVQRHPRTPPLLSFPLEQECEPEMPILEPEVSFEGLVPTRIPMARKEQRKLNRKEFSDIFQHIHTVVRICGPLPYLRTVVLEAQTLYKTFNHLNRSDFLNKKL